MRRAEMWWMLGVMCVAGCPSTVANSPGEAGVDRVEVGDGQDVSDAGDETGGDVADVGAGDADAGDVGGDDADAGDTGVPSDVSQDIHMTFEFTSAVLNGSSAGINMRANITWHGNLRGSAGGVTFEGTIR